MKLVILGLVSASLVGIGTAEAHQGRPQYNAASGARALTHAPVQSHSGNRYSYSRAQTYYSDTGWQPGTSAITQHGYGYGYGGTGNPPVVIATAPHQSYAYGPAVHQVQRSQPFGYVVDGYGRYPWSRQGQVAYGYGQGYGQGHSQACGQCHHHGHHQQAQVHVQAPVVYQAQPVYVSQPPIHVQAPPVYVQGAQVHVQAPPVHVAPPTVEVAPSQIIYDQGYFAAPAQVAPPPPPPPPPSTERPYRQEPGERG